MCPRWLMVVGLESEMGFFKPVQGRQAGKIVGERIDDRKIKVNEKKMSKMEDEGVFF
jgi:hypothetical protein